jgi:hypothetical protein
MCDARCACMLRRGAVDLLVKAPVDTALWIATAISDFLLMG